MRPNGSRVRQLAFNDGLADGFPAWSPNGHRVAFNSAFTPGRLIFASWEIQTMHADGSHQINRTRNPAFDIDPD